MSNAQGHNKERLTLWCRKGLVMRQTWDKTFVSLSILFDVFYAWYNVKTQIVSFPWLIMQTRLALVIRQIFFLKFPCLNLKIAEKGKLGLSQRIYQRSLKIPDEFWDSQWPHIATYQDWHEPFRWKLLEPHFSSHFWWKLQWFLKNRDMLYTR